MVHVLVVDVGGEDDMLYSSFGRKGYVLQLLPAMWSCY